MSIIIVGVGPAEFEGELGLGDTREEGLKHCPFLWDAKDIQRAGVSIPGVHPTEAW